VERQLRLYHGVIIINIAVITAVNYRQSPGDYTVFTIEFYIFPSFRKFVLDSVARVGDLLLLFEWLLLIFFLLLQLYGLGFVTCCNSELLLKLLIISTIGRTPWTGDQPDARPLPTQDNTTQRDIDKRSCRKRDSNPRSQRPSGQGQRFRPRSLFDWHVVDITVIYCYYCSLQTL
jgi:hypothetical protein